MKCMTSGRLPPAVIDERSRRMSRPKHVVKLTAAERAYLTSLIRTGSVSAQMQTRARILLKADCSEDGPAWDDATIAAAVESSRPTVERVRRAFARQGV